jgi:hypothetical protein
MLVSFSHTAMRPYVEAGIHQAQGHDVGFERVKRTTIRRAGPRYEELLARNAAGWAGLRLRLWWKSRTAERAKLGEAPLLGIERITILHGRRDGDPCLQVKGTPALFELFGTSPGCNYVSSVQWLHADVAARELTGSAWDDGHIGIVAYRDGFNTLRDFADFFVPKDGDRFEGVVLKW